MKVFTNRPRALVIDDHPRLMELYAELLRDLGYVVFTASTGALGISAVLEDRQFDLLVIDFFLPDTTGGYLLKEIRDLGVSSRAFLISANPEQIPSWAHKIPAVEVYSKNNFPLEEILQTDNLADFNRCRISIPSPAPSATPSPARAPARAPAPSPAPARAPAPSRTWA